MLLSAVYFLVVAQSSSEVPEGRMNNPVYIIANFTSKSSENLFICNLVTVALFDRNKQISSSYVLLQSVVIFTVQTSVVAASLRASRKDSTGLKLLDCSKLERLVE